MSETPSARRRKGREAFYRGGNPDDSQPYKGTLKRLQAHDWLLGWAEAQRADQIAIAAEIEADRVDSESVHEFARLYNLAKLQGLI